MGSLNKHRDIPLNLVSYFGGKWPHLNWLLPLFPKGNYHFIDIMCGSANVALNAQYPHITVNDLNQEIINLFHVLRNHKEEFLERLYFTPFSRKETEDAIFYEGDDPIEKARLYYVRCMIGFGANGSQNKHKGVGFEYTIQPRNYYKVDNWNRRLDKLPTIIEKLRHFQIESMDALDLFKRCNQKGNIIYFDPPYVLSTRKSKKRYIHEAEDDFHEKMCEAVQDAEAFVAISGYYDEENDIYGDLLPGWFRTDSPETMSNVAKIPRVECLWTNYNPEAIPGQGNLFQNLNY